MRLRQPMPAGRLAGWLGPLLVTAVAGWLRFWRLGEPHAVVFDETYYAKDAWSLVHVGAEQNWADKADERIIAGGHETWLNTPEYVVHPPVGKWVISLGEEMFGFDPYGWRFMLAVLGTLSVLVLCRVARRLFRSTLLGCTAGLLMSLDGLHFVLSRTAVLDLIVMFWVLLAFGCLLVDRDATRARLATWLEERELAVPAGDGATPVRGLGPSLGWRPWRLLGGLCLGLACGTKWNGAYFVVAFALMTYAWDFGARRSAGVRVGPPLVTTLVPGAALVVLWELRHRLALALGAVAVLVVVAVVIAVVRRTRFDLRAVAGAYSHAVAAIGSVVVLPVAVYILSWTGWFFAYPKHAYNGTSQAATRHHAGLGGLVPHRLWALWDYHVQAWNFHHSLTSHHDYASNPWSWPLLARPVSFFYQAPKSGSQGCKVADCSKAVSALGTPLLWWAGVLAVLIVAAVWVGHRDWRAGAITIGVAAGYLPWFLYQKRTIFSFYEIAFLPFLVLAVTMCLGMLLGGPGASERRRTTGAVVVGVYLCLVIWNFGLLYPILSAQVIPYTSWQHRMWLDSWI